MRVRIGFSLLGSQVLALVFGNWLGQAQTPFGGTPHPVSDIIQAEDFDAGGEGVGYHSISPGKAGNSYRQTDQLNWRFSVEQKAVGPCLPA